MTENHYYNNDNGFDRYVNIVDYENDDKYTIDGKCKKMWQQISMVMINIQAPAPKKEYEAVEMKDKDIA